MLSGINMNERKEFISSEDISEPKTIFILRPLSGADVLEFQQHISSEKMVITAENLLRYVNKAVVQIKNSECQGEKQEILKSLPASVLMELVTEIGNMNQITEQARKN